MYVSYYCRMKIIGKDLCNPRIFYIIVKHFIRVFQLEYDQWTVLLYTRPVLSHFLLLVTSSELQFVPFLYQLLHIGTTRFIYQDSWYSFILVVFSVLLFNVGRTLKLETEFQLNVCYKKKVCKGT